MCVAHVSSFPTTLRLPQGKERLIVSWLDDASVIAIADVEVDSSPRPFALDAEPAGQLRFDSADLLGSGYSYEIEYLDRELFLVGGLPRKAKQRTTLKLPAGTCRVFRSRGPLAKHWAASRFKRGRRLG